MGAPIRVGVCSWADETLSKFWYPKGVTSGEERLRYYAERFETVEANSTYYRLPDPHMVEKWVERTPPGFTMHVKAFGVMTRHPVKVDQLPSDLRDVPTDARGRVDRPRREYRAEVFMRFLEDHGMTYVTVDAPRTGGKNVLPTVVAATSRTAYVRFHGRNAETWNKRTGSAAERFDYLYSDDELREWLPTLKELAGEAQTVYAMFNNNGRSQMPSPPLPEAIENAKDGVVAQAPTNAQILKRLLGE